MDTRPEIWSFGMIIMFIFNISGFFVKVTYIITIISTLNYWIVFIKALYTYTMRIYKLIRLAGFVFGYL